MKELLEDAEQQNCAVGAFSVYSMEMLKGIVQAAEEMKTPVILQIAESRFPYAPFELMAPAMRKAAELSGVKMAVHLDHGLHIETIQKALDLQFSLLEQIHGEHPVPLVLYGGSGISVFVIMFTMYPICMAFLPGAPSVQLKNLPPVWKAFMPIVVLIAGAFILMRFLKPSNYAVVTAMALACITCIACSGLDAMPYSSGIVPAYEMRRNPFSIYRFID